MVVPLRLLPHAPRSSNMTPQAQSTLVKKAHTNVVKKIHAGTKHSAPKNFMLKPQLVKKYVFRQRQAVLQAPPAPPARAPPARAPSARAPQARVPTARAPQARAPLARQIQKVKMPPVTGHQKQQNLQIQLQRQIQSWQLELQRLRSAKAVPRLRQYAVGKPAAKQIQKQQRGQPKLLKATPVKKVTTKHAVTPVQVAVQRQTPKLSRRPWQERRSQVLNDNRIQKQVNMQKLKSKLTAVRLPPQKMRVQQRMKAVVRPKQVRLPPKLISQSRPVRHQQLHKPTPVRVQRATRSPAPPRGKAVKPIHMKAVARRSGKGKKKR